MQNATKKQLDFIASIEEFADESYNGNSKQDATNYIKRNIDTYKLMSMNSHVITNGY